MRPTLDAMLPFTSFIRSLSETGKRIRDIFEYVQKHPEIPDDASVSDISKQMAADNPSHLPTSAA
jgi:hypothetical protein